MEKFDNIIIGAGIAGLSASLTSMKLGMKTALIEKNSAPGGTARDCSHNYICGLFKNDDTMPFEIANKGLCKDIYKYFFDLYGDKALVKIGKVEVLAFIQEDLWAFFLNQLKEDNFSFYKNIKHKKTIFTDTCVEKILITTQHNKTVTLSADVFINATGSADLSKKSHDTYLPDAPQSDNDQLGGYSIILKGKSKKELSLIIPYTARKIIEKYNLENYLKFVTISYNFLSDMTVLKFSVQEGQDIEKCHFIYEKLVGDVKELANLKYLTSSKRIHLRSCDNLNFNGPNQKEEKTDEECIAKSYWPAEIWDKNRGTQYKYIKKDNPFCIPVAALKDKKYNNLFLAGKNIRVPKLIQASARVMGVCIATGEQASISAFKSLKEN
ncbi:MAG: hypothetical protein CMM60_03235 [Rhodospirillaceae bacterium]|jgi:2-polyprenyl-6-methoxyphenol hydroxylase-like FAD-dependent oxidoreductase|nr:hypothetical protein [Rhodospirillaceae bacterium]|tara:strand:- start:990 stop:2135 length:1146 start_codon:yes stop_codon:yes gene_type:complete